jgi:phosphohistidine phosphatase
LELLVVRHAIAEDRDVFANTGRGDPERPLTAEGRRRFEKGARGLCEIVESVDVLATSTLARAKETGAILAAAYELRGTSELGELAPESDPAALVPWLRKHRSRSRVAIVGHEPHLSRLVQYLLTGSAGRGFVSLKKGGACLLSLGDTPTVGGAQLHWLLTPAQLRRLG